MNFEKQLYEDIEALVKKDEAFFSKDFTLEDKVYRIYNYRLASWTIFQSPGALDARGIMFDITDQSDVTLVSLPPQKFFNYEEGGVNHALGKIGDKMVKMDGSLISSYIHKGNVFLKSKGSLSSSQALDAMKLLDNEENQKFKDELVSLVKEGYTINMEYTSPENRIVIPYQKEELTVLSMRKHADGENFFASKLIDLLEKKGGYQEMLSHMVPFEKLHDKTIEQLKFVDDVRKEQEGEGYVVEIILDEKNSYYRS